MWTLTSATIIREHACTGRPTTQEQIACLARAGQSQRQIGECCSQSQGASRQPPAAEEQCRQAGAAGRPLAWQLAAARAAARHAPCRAGRRCRAAAAGPAAVLEAGPAPLSLPLLDQGPAAARRRGVTRPVRRHGRRASCRSCPSRWPHAGQHCAPHTGRCCAPRTGRCCVPHAAATLMRAWQSLRATAAASVACQMPATQAAHAPRAWELCHSQAALADSHCPSDRWLQEGLHSLLKCMLIVRFCHICRLIKASPAV